MAASSARGVRHDGSLEGAPRPQRRPRRGLDLGRVWGTADTLAPQSIAHARARPRNPRAVSRARRGRSATFPATFRRGHHPDPSRALSRARQRPGGHVLRASGRRSRAGHDPHQGRARDVQHELGAGRHLGRVRRRRLSERARRGHAARRRRAVPAADGRARGRARARARRAAHRLRRALRSRGRRPGLRLPPRARGRPLASPGRASPRRHRRGDRAHAPRRRGGAPQHHARRPRDGRRPPFVVQGRRNPWVLRRVRARRSHRAGGGPRRTGHGAGHRRRGQGLPLHVQPRRGHRRRRRDRVPHRSDRREPRVHAVSW